MHPVVVHSHDENVDGDLHNPLQLGVVKLHCSVGLHFIHLFPSTHLYVGGGAGGLHNPLQLGVVKLHCSVGLHFIHLFPSTHLYVDGGS